MSRQRSQGYTTRMMRAEAPRQFLPNVHSSGLALANGMNSEFQITKMLVSCQSEQYWERYSRNK